MKKIKSEIKVDDDFFKIKIGTIDKKNPETIYIEFGTYITPTTEKKSYKSDIEKIEKATKVFIDNLLEHNEYLSKNHIFVSEVPFERIINGKKSFMEMQLFINPKQNLLKVGKFADISKEIKEKCVCKILPVVKESIHTNGFNYFKSRK